MASRQEKRYDPNDRTLTFVDGDDDLDFLCEEFDSRKAAMSCGNAVTPASLTKWCLILLKKGEYKFVCPAYKKGTNEVCGGEWPYTEVRKMALLTTAEIKYFEAVMASNASQKHFDVRLCPGCSSSVVREDRSSLSVRCLVCTANKGKRYEFCWQCSKEWKGPYSRSDRCDNDGCSNPNLDLLRTCPNITFERVTGVTGCPNIRACPICGTMVEHNQKGCKNIICHECKQEFCFVCLKLTATCLQTSSHYVACSSGVAPRQTSIPVHQKN
ncbi:uncharacterized protein LOC130130705 [Lampris incognitus]|uniref:uncharacterized protein LOC130130705 n=1 Tax=Lampris incognitus TaxID=2546036 RepID=UPI0024B6330A|nr:uncharacterized protein LOC130130705 [Lampris incognitus]